MNKHHRVLLGVVAGAVMAALSSGAAAEPITLKLHHFLPPQSPAQVKMLAPWAKRVEKSSGGKVKIEIYPSMTLGGKPPQLINQVRDGVVDIVWTVNGYTANLFPRTEVFELPFVYTNNPSATNLAMRAMFNKYLKVEYKGVHVLFLHVHQGQGIQTVNKPVHSPDDLKGLKFRIGGFAGQVLTKLGVVPQQIAGGDIYPSLEKGTIDAAEWVVPFLDRRLGLQDAAKSYYTTGWHEPSTTAEITVNEKAWSSLPKDLQAMIAQAAAATSISRAAAPALRIGSQLARTVVEPPVAWMPNNGLA